MKKIIKKKKAFTLIELVIVLAVLAIIALIAIPNFTKVRNDSLEKSDKRSAEQIEKITLMAVADQQIAAGDYTLKFNSTSKKFVQVNLSGGSTAYEKMLSEVKMPQVTDESEYFVTVGAQGDVQVRYKTGGNLLAGTVTLAS